LDKLKPVKYFVTRVSKLIGAVKYGDKVFIISELPWLYTLDLRNDTVKEYDLGYYYHTLGA